jgi:hypothetical protein
MQGWGDGKSISTFVAVFDSLLSIETVAGPSEGWGAECAGANDEPIASGESASATWGNKLIVVVYCRSASRRA